MSAVLLAVYKDHAAAEQVRTQLLRDGFPTDRMELTSASEPGRAATEPGTSAHNRYLQYFGLLFASTQEQTLVGNLVEQIEQGAATITVLPRGPVETARARTLLGHAAPRQFAQHDLDHQAWEHAAARYDHSWLSALWPERRSHAQCLYCLLFEDDSLERAEERKAATPSPAESRPVSGVGADSASAGL